MSLLQRTEKASGAPSSFNDSALDAMDINSVCRFGMFYR